MSCEAGYPDLTPYGVAPASYKVDRAGTVQDICTKSYTGTRFEAFMDKSMNISDDGPVTSFCYCD